MSMVLALVSLALIVLILMDGFESIVLPRRVSRRFRLTRLFYRYTWIPWSALARRLRPGRRRETYLSFFGPLSMLALLSLWALGLILAFALLHWSLGSGLRSSDGRAEFFTYFYLSGVTFFTLGFGDITPSSPSGQLLAVVEAGIGFAFLAVVIGYLPVLYQAFSRREVNISLLDARAGSPPTTTQLLIRMAQAHNFGALDRLLEEWERWAAVLLESHISFPVLSYYRSQHDNQSWLAALTAILDTCALVMAGMRNTCPYQAQLTFAIARHVAVDLALVFNTPPRAPQPDRLPPGELRRLHEILGEAGVALREGSDFAEKLTELRGMYEPFLNALSRYFVFTLPPLFSQPGAVDNWQTSAWTRRVAGIGKLTMVDSRDDHFD